MTKIAEVKRGPCRVCGEETTGMCKGFLCYDCFVKQEGLIGIIRHLYEGE